MDWYPLYNSLRIAAIACVAVFFTGIFAAYYVAKLPRLVKGLLDVVLTLPMVLPPTVVGTSCCCFSVSNGHLAFSLPGLASRCP